MVEVPLLLSPEEIAACVVLTEPEELKTVSKEALTHFAQMAACLGASKILETCVCNGVKND
jgi:hypothetical protein